MKPRLMLASGNTHKIAEIRAILDERLGRDAMDLISAADYPNVAEPVEDGATFEENALIKAKYWAAIAGMPALADDSGIEIDVLDGAPGVLSARYAATAELRNERVLKELSGVVERRRGARFVCVAALAEPSGATFTARGSVEGSIAHAPRGKGGFGYDPIFVVAESAHAGRAMAELSPDEKNAISHRGRAIAGIVPAIKKMFECCTGPS